MVNTFDIIHKMEFVNYTDIFLSIKSYHVNLKCKIVRIKKIIIIKIRSF